MGYYVDFCDSEKAYETYFYTEYVDGCATLEEGLESLVTCIEYEKPAFVRLSDEDGCIAVSFVCGDGSYQVAEELSDEDAALAAAYKVRALEAANSPILAITFDDLKDMMVFMGTRITVENMRDVLADVKGAILRRAHDLPQDPTMFEWLIAHAAVRSTHCGACD